MRKNVKQDLKTNKLKIQMKFNFITKDICTV